MNKTFIRIRRLELTREFVLFMIAFGVLITILLYSPNELRNVLVEVKNAVEEIKKIGEQNQFLAKQGVNNTDRIISDSANRFNISSTRTIDILDNLSSYINSTEQQRQASGVDFVNVMFAYLMDVKEDIDLIMLKDNITDGHGDSIVYNGTHLVSKDDKFNLPYPITDENIGKIGKHDDDRDRGGARNNNGNYNSTTTSTTTSSTTY